MCDDGGGYEVAVAEEDTAVADPHQIAKDIVESGAAYPAIGQLDVTLALIGQLLDQCGYSPRQVAAIGQEIIFRRPR